MKSYYQHLKSTKEFGENSITKIQEFITDNRYLFQLNLL